MNTLETTVRRLKQTLQLNSESAVVEALRPVYDFLLHAVYGRTGLQRRIHDEMEIRLRPKFRAVCEDVEPQVFQYLKSHVRPGSVILEIGANVGIFSIHLARWAGIDGQVFAFEPAPQSFAALQDHLALNGVRNRVTPLQMAVSDCCETATFYADGTSGESTLATTHPRVANALPVEIAVTTIDAFCERYKIVPDLVKIDVEGFELHVLQGAINTLAAHRPEVVVELHPPNWEWIGVTSVGIRQSLEKLGCRLTSLEGQIDPLVEGGHVALEYCG